jgi:hypothetical protein
MRRMLDFSDLSLSSRVSSFSDFGSVASTLSASSRAAPLDRSKICRASGTSSA